MSEVGRLGTALNTMLAQIEAAFAEKSASEARLRQFVADASHELRTPLTSIRGYAELLRKGAFATDDERERALARVEHEAARMGGLVDDLLLLARLDQGRPLLRVPVDLRRTFEEARAGRAPDGPAAPGSDLCGSSDPVVVSGDPDRLRAGGAQPGPSALVHTPPGASVTVGVGVAGPVGVATVADRGPGLTARRAERVFDRFYRGDAARTGVGTGLGLSDRQGHRRGARRAGVGGVVSRWRVRVRCGGTPGGRGPHLRQPRKRARGGPASRFQRRAERAERPGDKASRTGASLTSVSASSDSGSDPATMPAPARTSTEAPVTVADRMASIHSPSPAASVHPTGPAQ